MADEGQDERLKPVTVLFADISGSTLMYAERGDATAFGLTSTCLNLLEEQATAVGGRVVKRLGDAVLAVFETPGHAVDAAANMRRALDDPECPLRGEGVHVRFGISCGNAVLEQGDVYGDVVNVAARLVSLAGVDEIFFSGNVYEALPPSMRESSRLIDQLALRNRPLSVAVYQYLLGHDEMDDLTVSVSTRSRSSISTMEIRHGEQLFIVNPEHSKLTIGRHSDNDIVIGKRGENVVSRNHAEISLRGDKFLLIDRSTNGTYVHVDDGPVLRVAREEVMLAGSGRIVPGRAIEPPIIYRVTPSK